MKRTASNRTLPAPLSSAQLVRAHEWLGCAYQAWVPLFFSEVHRLALRRAALRNGESHLEVGVGTGLTFLPMVLSNPDGRNEGVDLSPAMLRRCRARLVRAGATGFVLREGDARQLPFEDSCFDLVVCCYVLDELPEEAQAPVLTQLRRVLRVGGRLILTNMTQGGWGLYQRLATTLPWALGGGRPVNLASAVLAQGFRDVSRQTYSRLGFSSELIRGVRV